ncbi:type IV pilus modification PilV family protein [Marinithermus hydrothermalis]|uniref:Secretion system protein n=1 Tax=Marinithermus hydrothermalis (strain DSM 14884 / JCM 11576 / T1) TaxID=869210 RepID=F2NL50_MARHT|nr:prepilin-type N-terminal cleavage/methylation domain-containing protein [Marinithermus hydrothermalis]AEB11453.1 secretion system protein [Marinithermus hydrothermalis DSM 14884]
MNRRGLTLLEVLVAMSILGVILAAFTVSAVSSLRHNAVSGSRTAAVQLVNYLGRRVVGGDRMVLPEVNRTVRAWEYGTLRAAFPDLPKDVAQANPDRFRAEVVSEGTPAWAAQLGLDLTQYRVRVCWRGPEEEHCTEVATLGVSPSAAGSAPPLPGIN